MHVACRACERSGVGAVRCGERSGHISFRVESAFLKIPKICEILCLHFILCACFEYESLF